MATTDDERRRQRERQYEIDRITAHYVAELRAGRAPKIEEYVQRYPDYEPELLEFAVTYHTIGHDAPEPAAVVVADLSPAAQRALAWVRGQREAAAPTPVEGLAKQGVTAGYAPPKLAAAVGLTIDLLAKLEAHAIAATTIPRILIERLSQALGVAPDAITAFLEAPPVTQTGAFYYADQAPVQRQESFLEAVQSSDLAPEAKRVWGELVRGGPENTP